MKTCHDFDSYVGWNSEYMEMVWFARIPEMEAAPKTQARKFHQPAKYPHGRPYFPAVIEAQ